MIFYRKEIHPVWVIPAEFRHRARIITAWYNVPPETLHPEILPPYRIRRRHIVHDIPDHAYSGKYLPPAFAESRRYGAYRAVTTPFVIRIGIVGTETHGIHPLPKIKKPRDLPEALSSVYGSIIVFLIPFDDEITAHLPCNVRETFKAHRIKKAGE
jgi:hypothetical protein